MAKRASGTKYIEAGIITRVVKVDESATCTERGHKVGLGYPPSARWLTIDLLAHYVVEPRSNAGHLR